MWYYFSSFHVVSVPHVSSKTKNYILKNKCLDAWLTTRLAYSWFVFVLSRQLDWDLKALELAPTATRKTELHPER